MIKKVLFAVLIMLFITGCATRASVMKSWLGNNIDNVTASWGAPSSIMQRNDGGATYTWSSISGNRYGVNQCRQTFVTNASGEIVRWSYNGCSEMVRTN